MPCNCMFDILQISMQCLSSLNPNRWSGELACWALSFSTFYSSQPPLRLTLWCAALPGTQRGRTASQGKQEGKKCVFCAENTSPTDLVSFRMQIVGPSSGGRGAVHLFMLLCWASGVCSCECNSLGSRVHVALSFVYFFFFLVSCASSLNLLLIIHSPPA